ncbi:MAG: stage II sporulation protein M [Archaeoglobaceae archaeon]|nr:stage II sporulation protein M [Archaeoglobaceae archaeon]MDW7990275.1 stage II sporulation protein M [Archaeoglobaceae archaeon]
MIRIVFVLLLILFFGSCYLGYFLAETFPEAAKREIENLRDLLSSFTDDKLSLLEIFLLIFLNNTIKSFFAMLLGIFFGIVPIIFIFLNGLIIGFFAKFVSEEVGMITFILLILPHGIIEIPAVILACSYGFWLGIEFVRDRKNILKHLVKAISNFAKLVLPMLFVAAVIESLLISINA